MSFERRRTIPSIFEGNPDESRVSRSAPLTTDSPSLLPSPPSSSQDVQLYHLARGLSQDHPPRRKGEIPLRPTLLGSSRALFALVRPLPDLPAPLGCVCCLSVQYPSSIVNGIVLGSPPSARSSGPIEIVDSIPLLHHWTSLSPSMEIGLELVRSLSNPPKPS
jgi:hypothetical protein